MAIHPMYGIKSRIIRIKIFFGFNDNKVLHIKLKDSIQKQGT